MQMEKFQATLNSFTQTLVKRGLGKQLNIEIKDPQHYTMNDVLEITQRVQKRHADADSRAFGSLKVIRKCFRQAVKSQGILSNLLNFLPSDCYSSVICGGFTIILGVRLLVGLQY